jgi:hypothetical protein
MQAVGEAPIRKGSGLKLSMSNPIDQGGTIVLMTADEARNCVARIRMSMENARRDMLDLHDREGWKALGYANWRDCASAEFSTSVATAYRYLEAAAIERETDFSQIEKTDPLPVSQLQALKDTPPDQRPAVIAHADELADDGKRTAAHVQEAAAVTSSTVPWPEFKAAKARHRALGATLEAKIIGGTLHYVTHWRGADQPGIQTPTWSNVIDRLEAQERLAAKPKIPEVAPALADPLIVYDSELLAQAAESNNSQRYSETGKIKTFAYRDRRWACFGTTSKGMARLVADGYEVVRAEEYSGPTAPHVKHGKRGSGAVASEGGKQFVITDRRIRILPSASAPHSPEVADIPHLPPPAEWRAAQQRASAIGMHLSMDARGAYSLLNDGGSGVSNYREWRDILTNLANCELSHAENQAPVFSSSPDGLPHDLQRQLIAAGAGVGEQNRVYPPRSTGEAPAVMDEAAARAALARWGAQPNIPNVAQSSDAIRRQAAALLRQIAPLMRQIQTEDMETLSQTITDLSESPERGEAPYWINVGWAMLDMEPEEERL